ncbi:MAG: hypothetical protein IAE83_21065 [Anaerolinea sp.]|nr:hypothetical protein [Anaerolinea sp.]
MKASTSPTKSQDRNTVSGQGSTISTLIKKWCQSLLRTYSHLNNKQRRIFLAAVGLGLLGILVGILLLIGAPPVQALHPPKPPVSKADAIVNHLRINGFAVHVRPDSNLSWRAQATFMLSISRNGQRGDFTLLEFSSFQEAGRAAFLYSIQVREAAEMTHIGNIVLIGKEGADTEFRQGVASAVVNFMMVQPRPTSSYNMQHKQKSG